jgi:peptidoglycan/LPS O-acetylase OafA/YrhL
MSSLVDSLPAATAKPTMAKLRLEFLDGLRGWGSVMVFLYHLIVQLLANTTPSYKNKAFAFVLDGDFAVFIFFVLSGFVLSIKFIASPGKYSLTQAVIARYFRLMLPIIITSLIAYVLMLAHAMYNVQAAGPALSPDWMGSYFNFEPTFKYFLQFNLYYVFFNFNPGANFNPVLWTIAYEFTGSMLVYLLIGFFRNTKNQTYLIPVALLIAFNLVHNPIIAFFAIGYVLAELYVAYEARLAQSAWASGLATALILVPIIGSTFYRTQHHFYQALLATAMVLAVSFSGVLKRFFSNKLSRFLGRISFPLYLIHLPLICSYSSYLFIALPNYGWSHQAASNLIIASTVPLGIFLAWVIYPIETFSVKASKAISEKIMQFPLIKPQRV